MTGNLEGRIAVVTGGGQGIGRRIAQRLSEVGAQVAVWDRDFASAQQVASDLNERGIGVSCDVSDPESVRQALESTVATLGTPTVVVTAAGIAIPDPFLQATAYDFERQLSVNLTGTFSTFQTCARAMTQAHLTGAMVAIASVAARGPRPDLTAYAASKAGVLSVVRSAAVALAAHGIRANAICPGVVDTEMTRKTQAERAQALEISEEQALSALVNRIPLGRIQTVDDVADVVMFLVSSASSYVTGQALNACGGLEFD